MAVLNQFHLLSYLVDKNIIPSTQENRVKDAMTRTGTSVEKIILELGIAPEENVYRSCAEFLGVLYVDPTSFEQFRVVQDVLPTDFVRRSEVLILQAADDTELFISTQLDQADLEQSLSFLIGRSLAGGLFSPATFRMFLQQIEPESNVQDTQATDGDIERLQAMANDGPVVKYTTEMIQRAVDEQASDVHIEATPEGARIRFRIDGDLQQIDTLSESNRDALVSRLKVVSDLNISERRRPQDGRLDMAVRGRKIDLRLSTLPTQHGESVVLRILDQSQVRLDWGALGFGSERTQQVRDMLAMPNGIFLVAGPTGSGKTTTLYTALSELNHPTKKILTVEDPIEYSIEGINQVQVDRAVGLDFANVLRAMLRQDGNVILVGEIRDRETAEIAVRAALIGRLVLSTVHTNDSSSTIDRLLDLGVEPYLIAATLRGVLSQRLVKNNAGVGKRRLVTQIMTMDEQLKEAVSLGARGNELAQKVKSSASFASDPEFI